MFGLRSFPLACLTALLLTSAAAADSPYRDDLNRHRTHVEDVGAASVRLSTAAMTFHYAAEEMPNAKQADPFLKQALALRKQIDLFRAELDTDADPRRLARKFDRVSRAYDDLMSDVRKLRREDRDHLGRRTDRLREAYARVADSLGL